MQDETEKLKEDFNKEMGAASSKEIIEESISELKTVIKADIKEVPVVKNKMETQAGQKTKAERKAQTRTGIKTQVEIKEKSEFNKNEKMDAAIVTGASSGIGHAVSERLGALGYEVYGVGREFAQDALWNQAWFHPVVCDLLDTEKLCAYIKEAAAQSNICILVNNAGVGYYGLHEELNPKKIRELVRVNLETPMILTQQLLRQLKRQKGAVINIVSVTAQQSNPHGCAYGAVKAGLASFSRSLFDEARKYGVKVAAVYPDMTKTNLYRNADFREGEEEDSYLLPEEVADAVEFILGQRDGVVVSEITVRPQIHRIRR